MNQTWAILEQLLGYPLRHDKWNHYKGNISEIPLGEPYKNPMAEEILAGTLRELLGNSLRNNQTCKGKRKFGN